MTGYGRARVAAEGREITLEIKTVNHRFLDLSTRLPRALNALEDVIRSRLSGALRRGHADVSVQYVNARDDAREIRVDQALMDRYRQAADAAARATGIANDCALTFYLAQPDVMTLTTREDDQDALSSLLQTALDAALGDVVAMREREGAALKADLTAHLNALESLSRQIAALAPAVPLAYRDRLLARVAELGVVPDEQRLAQETALMADKCAIDEELSRLASHIAQMREAMEADGEAGRRLDFLTQELNREVNTVGSKALDAAITRLVVAAKSEIEKLREQVQNIE